jgi:RNA-directed DNA polymerase
MNFRDSTTDKTERLKDTSKLTVQWETMDWNKAENHVNRLQTRIAKAAVKSDWNKVKRLQYLLTHSFYAKALAIKKVTSNKGKNTSGVDKKIWCKRQVLFLKFRKIIFPNNFQFLIL